MPQPRSLRWACVAVCLGSLLETGTACLAAEPASEITAAEPVPADAAKLSAAGDPSEGSVPLELELSANQIRYDGLLDRVVAEGNVQASIAGGRLLSDRLEFETRSRSVLARGNVRLQRGQQYLQASQLRFNLLEGSGEAEDVYGILDLDGSQSDFLLDQPPSMPLPAPEPLSCTPSLPPVPEWHPYNWALTAWGGQMIDANFGDAFLFNGRWRPEYLAGVGANRRFFEGGPLDLELDVNLLGHGAYSQAGGLNQPTPSAAIPAQGFAEGTLGLGLRIWMRPWLNIFLVEGISYLSAASNYERTFRSRYAQLLNYLAFEIEALVTPRWSMVGRLHHRSGAYGVYSGVREGSNAYLIGARYRFGNRRPRRQVPLMPPAQGCPDAQPPPTEDALARDTSLETGPGDQGAEPGLWRRAQAQEEARRKAIQQLRQRVTDVNLQQSLRIERRVGFNDRAISSDQANTYGGIRPEQLRQLNTTSNMRLVDGGISRWRFQARRIRLNSTGWSALLVGLTNDPYTPAQSWLEAAGVEVRVIRKGQTLLTARSTRILLEDRLSIPGRLRQRIRQNRVESPLVVGFDTVDRGGVFVGYNVKPIKIGSSGSLRLQPQFNLQRTIEGSTNSYPLPGSPPGSPGVTQGLQDGDQVGLLAQWSDSRWGFASNATLDVSTLSSQNFASGTRSWGDVSRNVRLPLLGESTAKVFGAYRYRTWNGSLGEQDVYTAYGLLLEDQGQLPSWGPINNSYFWRAGLGNYRACTSDCPTVSTGGSTPIPNLGDFWRGSAVASLTSSIQLWSGKPLPATNTEALINSPLPIVPSLRLETNINGTMAYYNDGQNQNTLSFSLGPILTLGHFSRPLFDYTQLAVTGGVTLRQGLSPLSFDRAVDLGTLNLGLTQQIAGPLLLSAGYGFNIDPASGYYGATTGSYIELRWQRRAYDIGIYYSPYEQLGGIRIRLNDFNFKGPGVPFVPYHPSQAGLQRPF